MTKRAAFPLVAVLCSLPLVAGCTVNTANNPSKVAVQLAPGLADGQPTNYQPGARLSYWVWQEPKGIWHVRTTTAKNKHRFQGSIRPMQGTRLSDPRRVATGQGDKISANGDEIRFDFETQGDDDGFDFRAEGNACIQFELRVDDKPRANYIVVGKNQTAPASSRFLACP